MGLEGKNVVTVENIKIEKSKNNFKILKQEIG